MSDLRLRARSATELVDAAFALYRREPLPFIVLTAFAYAPWLVVRLVLTAIASRGTAGATSGGTMLVVVVGGAILYLLTLSVMSAALVRLAAQAYLGEPLDVGFAVRDGLSRLGAIIVAAIVKTVLMGVGMLLFLVGMFYVAARLFAINEVIVLEQRGAGEAIARSGELSRGRKGHILATLGLVGLVYILVFFAVTAMSALSGSAVFAEVANTVYVAVAYPLFAITETLLYYDARIRGEGYDIELMAGALGAPGAATGHAAR